MDAGRSTIVRRRPTSWLLLACALVVLGNAGCQVTAFRGYGTDTLHIHSVASGATTNTNQGIYPDTSPSIAMKPDGSYLVAFRALGSLDLFIYNTATGTSTDTGQGVHPGTSPSIAVKPDGSFAVAFRGYGTDTIFIYNSTTGISTDTHQGIYAGTSPSITAMSNGSYSVAFRALGSLDLFVYNTATGLSTDTGQGVHPDTSPTISAIRGGGYNAAFRGYGTDTIHVYNPAAGVSIDTHQGIWPGTSPSIISLRDGGYEIAFRALGSLDQFIYSSATGQSTDTGQGVHPGTSPSITGFRYWTSEKYGGANGSVDTDAERQAVANAMVAAGPDGIADVTGGLAPDDRDRVGQYVFPRLAWTTEGLTLGPVEPPEGGEVDQGPDYPDDPQIAAAGAPQVRGCRPLNSRKKLELPGPADTGTSIFTPRFCWNRTKRKTALQGQVTDALTVDIGAVFEGLGIHAHHDGTFNYWRSSWGGSSVGLIHFEQQFELEYCPVNIPLGCQHRYALHKANGYYNGTGSGSLVEIEG